VAPAARVARALDVGCGTGLSTRPLRRLARTVVGLDPAAAMLREAKRARRASYVQGRAEQLPVTDASFDVVTIGCAYHWCDSEAFLGEAARILRSGGALVIYDNGFLGEVSGSAAILEWLKSEHWSRLPEWRGGRRRVGGAFPERARSISTRRPFGPGIGERLRVPVRGSDLPASAPRLNVRPPSKEPPGDASAC
jgi:SAM-dependent methyltransferase